MAKVTTNDVFYCARLDMGIPGDLRALHKIKIASLEETVKKGGDYDINPEMAKCALDFARRNGAINWYHLLNTRGQFVFTLFKQVENGDGLPIGISHTLFPDVGRPHPLIEGLYIMEDYRGQKLTDLLYMAQLNFLNEAGHSTAILDIHPENEPSIGAAERNGFRKTGETREGKLLLFCDDIGRVLFPSETRSSIPLDHARPA